MLATGTEIESFLEIYQTKHISRAALRIGVTQPALTQCLQKLEEKLQCKLFLRSKRGVVPTAEGVIFYAKAHALLDSWRTVNEGVRASKTEIQGRFRIGCHPSVGAYTAPALIKRLNTQAPGIEIDLVHDFSRKITEGVVSYSIDLGYVVNPVRHPDLVMKKLGSDRVMFWQKKGATPIPRRLFADASLVQIDALLGKSYQKAFNGWSLVQSTSLELVRTLTLSGQGVGILPERVAKADQAPLVIYDRNLPVYQDEIYLIYRKEALESRAGKELVKLAAFELQ